LTGCIKDVDIAFFSFQDNFLAVTVSLGWLIVLYKLPKMPQVSWQINYQTKEVEEGPIPTSSYMY
jgi:hypothetical protein